MLFDKCAILLLTTYVTIELTVLNIFFYLNFIPYIECDRKHCLSIYSVMSCRLFKWSAIVEFYRLQFFVFAYQIIHILNMETQTYWWNAPKKKRFMMMMMGIIITVDRWTNVIPIEWIRIVMAKWWNGDTRNMNSQTHTESTFLFHIDGNT